MESYIILLLFIEIVVMVGMTVHGAKKGFVRLFSTGISLLVSLAAVIFLSSTISSYQSGETDDFWFGILFLIILAVFYKIVHKILSSIGLIAKLPVLHGLDKVLGVILGFCEGFAILYFGEYFLRMYLLS